MRFFYLILLLCSLNSFSFAQNVTIGVNSAAAAFMRSIPDDPYAGMYAPACVADSGNRGGLSFCYKYIPDFFQVSDLSFMAQNQWGKWRTGLFFRYYGDKEFQRNLAGIFIAHRIRQFSVGMNMVLKNYFVSEYYSRWSVLATFSAQASLFHNRLRINYGFHNLFFSEIQKGIEKTEMFLALVHVLGKHGFYGIECAKNMKDPVALKVAAGAALQKWLSISGGVSFIPLSVHAGLHLRCTKSILIAYAFVYYRDKFPDHFFQLQYVW